MVICTRCGLAKPVEAFGRNSKKRNGLDSWCNPCRAERARERYKADPDKYRQASQDFRARTGCAIEYAREYRARNPEKCKQANRRWREQNRAKIRKYDVAQRGTDKRKARDLVNAAIKSGKLIVQPCERCGYGVGVHAHHEDYSKPLEVNWLCRRCHGQRHREINEERRKTA